MIHNYNNLLKKFYKVAMQNAEKMSQSDKELAQLFVSQVGGAKAGKVIRKPQVGGRRKNK